MSAVAGAAGAVAVARAARGPAVRCAVACAVLAAALAVSVAGQLALGRGLALDGVWAALTRSGADPTGEHILWALRMPRAAVAVLAGACLGVSGLLLQIALRNPLASPELTGVGGGAVLGVVVALRLGAVAGQAATAVLAAMAGGLAGGGLLWLLSGRRRTDPVWLTINGVLVGVALSGVTAVLLVLSQAEAAGALRWLTGSLTGLTADHLRMLAPWAALGILSAWLLSPLLAVMQGGDEHAAAVGLAVRPARFAALLCAVVLAAAAVAVVGVVGFVGLIAPLLATAVVGREPRLLVPVTALAGAVAVSAADAVAQAVTLLVPAGAETQRLGLPAGSVTAVAGAVLLIIAVRRQHTLGERP
ncbi:iron chelate uptake ABC transporter family permease subunit [Marinitenerispora sediminis]|uniref:Iron ABC transporter n=1 Tax=Marinitenerispora sediminis TaxID=1931232 RepID=A0A368TAX2_9ACTN|nr:iron chelate uptake ABC transporter family permease subunit [Marinitenerispora sediminis]RCV48493.1 iron ABC transporter [Marinitenerispora sediminis]RCV48686.1 iron ABC transporter [Marinitenerispora sediminis]RCV62176.1 iron ABC transporter [Marinitenerispora sediminis]